MQCDVLKIIVFFGPPGTGKGTLAQRCVFDLGWKHISTGSLCRKFISLGNELGFKVAEKINNGHYIEDELMLEMVSSAFDDFYKKKENYSNTLILDGFPRNNKQIDLMLNFLKNKNLEYEFKFALFEASDEVVIDRLKSRVICSNKDCELVYSNLNKDLINCKKCNSLLIKREDDKEELILIRLENYYKIKNGLTFCLKEKLINNFFIDANKSSDFIFNFFTNYVCSLSLKKV